MPARGWEVLARTTLASPPPAALAHSSRCRAASSFRRSLRGPPHIMCSAIEMNAGSTPKPLFALVSKYSQPNCMASERPSSRDTTRSSTMST